jgi:hypothetical protein
MLVVFSPSLLVSSTNKTACHNIDETLLKVALNTIKETNKQYCYASGAPEFTPGF